MQWKHIDQPLQHAGCLSAERIVKPHGIERLIVTNGKNACCHVKDVKAEAKKKGQDPQQFGFGAATRLCPAVRVCRRPTSSLFNRL